MATERRRNPEERPNPRDNHQNPHVEEFRRMSNDAAAGTPQARLDGQQQQKSSNAKTYLNAFVNFILCCPNVDQEVKRELRAAQQRNENTTQPEASQPSMDSPSKGKPSTERLKSQDISFSK